MPTKSKTMSRAAYAKHRGVSRAAVTQWATLGRLVLTETGAVLVAESDARLTATLNTRGGRGGKQQNGARKGVARAKRRDQEQDLTPEAETLTKARTDHTRTQAQLSALEYRQRIGELCEVTQMRKAIRDCETASRRIVEQIPNRIAARLAATLGVDVRNVQGLMQAEVDRILEAIADIAAALPEKLTSTEH